jgi:hypothetical protein
VIELTLCIISEVSLKRRLQVPRPKGVVYVDGAADVALSASRCCFVCSPACRTRVVCAVETRQY